MFPPICVENAISQGSGMEPMYTNLTFDYKLINGGGCFTQVFKMMQPTLIEQAIQQQTQILTQLQTILVDVLPICDDVIIHNLLVYVHPTSFNPRDYVVRCEAEIDEYLWFYQEHFIPNTKLLWLDMPMCSNLKLLKPMRVRETPKPITCSLIYVPYADVIRKYPHYWILNPSDPKCVLGIQSSVEEEEQVEKVLVLHNNVLHVIQHDRLLESDIFWIPQLAAGDEHLRTFCVC